MKPEFHEEEAISRHGGSYSVAIVFCLALFIGYLVRRAYFDATFILDDVYYLEAIGLTRLGRSSIREYLLTLHGGYLHVLAKSQFYLLWKLFGLNPVPFRIAIAAAQGISAACLFVVFRHYLSNNGLPVQQAGTGPDVLPDDTAPEAKQNAILLAPWIVSLTWAALAVGGYDNVFLFIATGEQAMCIMWLTIAMVIVTQFRRYPLVAGLGMALCMMASTLTWGLGLAMTPAIAVQYLLFERANNQRTKVPWLGLWLLVVSAVVLLHLALRATHQEPSSMGELNWNMPFRFVEQFAVALGNMLGFMHQQAGDSTGIKLTLAAALLVTTACMGQNARRLLAIFLVATMCYVAVLVVFRSDRNLYDGRYLYVPSILWCVCLGLVVDGLYRRSPAWSRRGVLLAVAIAGIAFFSHQRSVVLEARAQFDEYFSATEEALEGYSLLTDALEQQAEKTGFDVRMPLFPIVVPPTYFPMYFPYDAWIAVSRSTPPPGLSIESPGEISPNESQAAAQFLDQLSLPQAREAAQAIRTVGPDIRNLLWLSDFATEKGITIRLPDYTYVYPELDLRFSLAQCLYSSFATPLPSLEVVPKSSVEAEEILKLVALLGTNPAPEAAAWVAFLQQLDPS